VVFGALVFKLPVWCRVVGCVSGLRDAAASRKFKYVRLAAKPVRDYRLSRATRILLTTLLPQANKLENYILY